MDRTEKKILKEILKEIEFQNILQRKMMFKYFLESFFRSVIIFGTSNEVTKETIRIYKNLKEINKEEYKIHNFLKKYAEKIDKMAVSDFLEQLEELNEKTIKYYCEALDDILTACDLKNEIYAKHAKKDFETLSETSNYKTKAASLLITFEDIKQILKFEDNFWKYIEKRIVFINAQNDTKFKIDIKLDGNNNAKDFMITLPSIVDMQSIKKCVELLEYTYYLYKYLGKKIENKDELNIIDDEKINAYILKKFN